MPSNSTRGSVSTRGGGGASSSDVDGLSYSHSHRLAFPSLVAHDSSDLSPERVEKNADKWSDTLANAMLLLLSNYSLARALGEDADSSVSNVEKLAQTLMTKNEADMYINWMRGEKAPRVSDWRSLRTRLHANTTAQKARWEELNNALSILYKGEATRADECKGWMEKYKTYVPLLIAAKKVELVRHDARAAKSSSRARRTVHEMVACRRVQSEVGKFRIEMNAVLHALHREANARETDLLKRLHRVDRETPRRADAAKEQIKERDNVWRKLTKIRVERVQMTARGARQNAELATLETLLKARMAGLDDRLRAERRRQR